MAASNPLTAEILEASANGFAAAANAKLRGKLTAEDPQADPTGALKANLVQRILELATAVRVNDPSLFARRIDWLRLAYKARGADDRLLRLSIESLRDALDEELPEDSRGDVSAALELAIDALSGTLGPITSDVDPSTENGRLCLTYIERCLEGKTSDAMTLILDAIAQGKPVESVYIDVLIPAQRETGRLWHVGDIGVAEERLVSETTKQLIAVISRAHEPADRKPYKVLAAAVAGNTHDIGIRVIADLYRLAGWQCIYLGGDVPIDEVAKAAQIFAVDLVVLGATITTHLNQVAETIAEVRRAAPDAKILVGGLAFRGSVGLWQTVGADGFAEAAESAVDAGTALVTA